MNRPGSGRPRSQTNKSTISHKSNKSETHSEKTARGLTTKADPNSAVNEAQPSAIALESSTLGSLTEQVAKDGGNGSSERDVSNPTRYRWERPLDTIRSFEAAIDRRFKQNAAISDGASVFDGMSSPRSSFYGGGLNQHLNPRGSTDAFHTRQHRASTYGGDDFGSTSNVGFYGNQRNARYSQFRGQSDSNVYGYRNSAYMGGGMGSRQPSQHYVPNDTSSGESHQWTQHTDPSSMNSSVDRLSPSGPPPPPPAKHDQPRRETYGLNGFGQDPSLEYSSYGQQNYSNGGSAPPPPPPHNANGNQPAAAAPRAPIKFTSSGPPPTREEVFPQKEKRRSMFSLRKK